MSRPYADQIGAFDFAGDPEPIDACIDCGNDIQVGLLRCAICQAEHDNEEVFETHADDPRR